MLAILLALGGSVSLGAADFLAGRRARSDSVLPVLVVAQVAGLATLAPLALLAGGPPPTASGFWILAGVAGLGQVAGVAAFWRGLAVGAMGVVAPLSASSALLPMGVGLAQGERPTAIQLVGLGAVGIGVVLTASEPAGRAGGRRRVASGAGLALLAAVGVGLFPVAIDAASAAGSAPWAVLASRLCSCALVAVPAILWRERLRRARRALPTLAPIGALEIVGLLLIAAATTHGLLTIVGVIGALYPVTTVGLAWLVLGERLHAAQRIGAAVALGGIVAVTVGAS